MFHLFLIFSSNISHIPSTAVFLEITQKKVGKATLSEPTASTMKLISLEKT